MFDFGSLLKRYRRNSHDPERGGSLTQPRLIEFLESSAGLPGYHVPQLSDWENNKRPIAHTDRTLLIGLLQVFYQLGGISSVSEANQLLRAGKYSDLDEDEIAQVNKRWTEKDGYSEKGFTEIAEPPHRAPEPLLQSENLSPFVVGPPITVPRQFFGRERELRRLFNLWKTFPMEHAAIVGLKRSGKTSLLQYIRRITTTEPTHLRVQQRTDWLPEPERYRWIMVDFQDARMCNRERLLSYLLAQLALPIPEPCTLETFMDAVSYQIETPTIVLMDEIGAAIASLELDEPFWENFRSLANIYANGNLSFVLTAHASPLELVEERGITSPFFNIFRTFQIGPLKEDEARELIESSPRPFLPADVEWIVDKSQRWPSLLQILCKVRLAALEEELPTAEWQEEGLLEVARFQYLLESSNGRRSPFRPDLSGFTLE